MTSSHGRCGVRTVQRWGRIYGAIAGVTLLFAGVTAQAAATPELWFYNQTNLQVQANVDATKALIDRAVAAGYTHMMVADTKLSWDGDRSKFYPDLHLPKLRDVIAYGNTKGIKIVPSTFDIGRAENWLLPMVNQNLAEGQKVVGATYTVNSSGQLVFQPQNPNLNNTSFASASSWSLDPGRAFIDTTTGRTDSSALRISAGGGRGFAIQNIAVQPNKQYKVTFWARTQNFSGDLMVKMYDGTAGRFRESHEGNPALSYTSNQAWTQYEYVFNSAASTNLQFRVGSWGNTSGTMWFDDVKIEEIALHNVVRAGGSPLKIYKPDGTLLNETAHLNPINEPAAPSGQTSFKLSKAPITPTLRAGSGLSPGDTVKIDYYAVQPIYQNQYGASLSEPGIYQYQANNIKQLLTSFAPGTGFMLGGYDEIRHGYSTQGAKDAAPTAGALLAQAFRASYDVVRKEDPNAPIYTWSDMFDPNHNARDKFYLWDGNLTGAWEGLPDDVIIMNWLRTSASLAFFSNLGNEQVISGFYDQVGQGYNRAIAELAAAEGIPGIRGLMYTTWGNNYGDLEPYAQGFYAAWDAYVASIPEPGTISLLLLSAGLLLRRRRA